MKGGVTKRIEDTVKALEAGQLKKALYLTEADGLERHHSFIEQSARTCLSNKDNKEACSMAIKEAREKVQDTISLPIDDTSLEGLEEYLTEQKPVEQASSTGEAQKPEQEKTDEELYEECEECHVAVAASRFADICADNPEEAGSCELISKSLEDEKTEPVDWIKAMVQTAEDAKGKAKEEMVESVSELSDYLERRDSPILKQLGDEEKSG